MRIRTGAVVGISVLALLLAACSDDSGPRRTPPGEDLSSAFLAPGPGLPTADAVADETIRIINAAADPTAVDKLACDPYQGAGMAEGLIESLTGRHAKAKRESVHPRPDGGVDYWITAIDTSGAKYAHDDTVTLTTKRRPDGTWCLDVLDVQ